MVEFREGGHQTSDYKPTYFIYCWVIQCLCFNYIHVFHKTANEVGRRSYMVSGQEFEGHRRTCFKALRQRSQRPEI
jgi:hypothetical protein